MLNVDADAITDFCLSRALKADCQIDFGAWFKLCCSTENP